MLRSDTIHRLLRPALLLVALLATAIPAAAQTPAPVYFVTTPDAVTGDNPFVVWSGRINGVQCPASAGCILPDANSMGSVDSYAADVYERPTSIGQGSQTEYFPQIDITQSSVGYDDDFLYYRFTLYGGTLDAKYGFEINFDADAVGDMFIEVDDPAAKVQGDWDSDHVQAYLDQDNTVGGANQLGAEGPGNINGYELKVYQTGNNQYPGAPGGDDVIVARLINGQLELAVQRVFLDAINGGVPVEKAAFRPLATTTSFNEDSYYLHDEFSRWQMGSPYPWLSQSGAPTSCPTTSDASLTPTQLAALESGVSTATAYVNPCFPSRTVNQLDIGGTVQDFSEPVLQFEVDLGIAKTSSQDSVSVGDPITFTLTATNLTSGSGLATGIVVTDTVPPEVDLVSATPSAGSCSGDPVVVCALGDMPNGSTRTVTIVANGATPGPLLNRGWIDANETDIEPDNDSSAVGDLVVYNGATSVVEDGVDTLPRVPSNGVSHPYVFDVSHTYSSNKDVQLFAFLQVPGALSVDSITGPNVVAGVTPDVATLVSRPRNAEDPVTVWIDLADVPRETLDSLYLKAEVLATPSEDEGWVYLQAIRPALDIFKTVAPKVNVVPGTELTYTVTLANVGDASANDVVLVDSIPQQISFKLGSITESLPAGVTVTRLYSSDNGMNWSYSPTSEGCGAPAGYDACVTRIRWELQNPLPDTTSTPGASAQVTFVTRVN